MVDTAKIEQAVRELLAALGEDTDREGLRETPQRVARFWREFIDYDGGNRATTFETVETDQLVLVRGVTTWSLCEHHLLPFRCRISMAYIARTRLLGLSKLARIAQVATHRLQVQERLAQQIADEIEQVTASPDVAVLIRGEHTCMTMRGIRSDGEMVTSVVRGAFRENGAAREEFLLLERNG